MKIDVNLIFNIVIGLFIYNIILKALGSVILNRFLDTDTMKEKKKSFQEKLKEKMEESENQKK